MADNVNKQFQDQKILKDISECIRDDKEFTCFVTAYYYYFLDLLLNKSPSDPAALELAYKFVNMNVDADDDDEVDERELDKYHSMYGSIVAYLVTHTQAVKGLSFTLDQDNLSNVPQYQIEGNVEITPIGRAIHKALEAEMYYLEDDDLEFVVSQERDETRLEENYESLEPLAQMLVDIARQTLGLEDVSKTSQAANDEAQETTTEDTKQEQNRSIDLKDFAQKELKAFSEDNDYNEFVGIYMHSILKKLNEEGPIDHAEYQQEYQETLISQILSSCYPYGSDLDEADIMNATTDAMFWLTYCGCIEGVDIYQPQLVDGQYQTKIALSQDSDEITITSVGDTIKSVFDDTLMHPDKFVDINALPDMDRSQLMLTVIKKLAAQYPQMLIKKIVENLNG